VITDQIICDVCGCAKGETNHWLVAVGHAEFSGIAFVPAEDVRQPRDIDGGKYEDICGHACAAKRLSQWLETLK
jgi:hypothetical protein